MASSTRPFITIYIARHPKFSDGEAIAKLLFDHYRRDLLKNVAGGAGMSVIYRDAFDNDTRAPMDIDFDDADVSAIVMLIDENWVNEAELVAWGNDLMERTDQFGLAARVFPVAIDDTAIGLGMAEQALRWDKWSELTQQDKACKLLSGLTYQLCRMLRTHLEKLKHPADSEEQLDQYLRKVEIFLSHSKHDDFGEDIAKAIRIQLNQEGDLDSFFDVHNIPPGLRFNKVILRKVKVSAVIAIHTDSYSSREWCRLEIIAAKRWHVPLIVVNSIETIDERAFPYLGNSPVIRMEPRQLNRIGYVIKTLLDEVLKDFVWRCRVQLAENSKGNSDSDSDSDSVKFLPRTPELISLVEPEDLIKKGMTLIYPDPPIGAEEQKLFDVIAPNIILQSMTQWLAEDEL